MLEGNPILVGWGKAVKLNATAVPMAMKVQPVINVNMPLTMPQCPPHQPTMPMGQSTQPPIPSGDNILI